jgi:branched-subunit amino acid transport protein
MSDLTPVLVLAAVCWCFRIVFIVVIPAHRLPTLLIRALGHLSPAVLAALIAVETQSAARTGPPLAAGAVVGSVLLMGLVARRTRSLLWTIVAGSAAVVLLDVVLL